MLTALTALGDPTRQHIVEMLADGELSAGEISERFDISGAAISQHLKVLKEANIVSVRIEKQKRIYSINPSGLTEINSWIDRINSFWLKKLDLLEQELNKDDRNE